MYRKGRENVVADTLSQKFKDLITLKPFQFQFLNGSTRLNKNGSRIFDPLSDSIVSYGFDEQNPFFLS